MKNRSQDGEMVHANQTSRNSGRESHDSDEASGAFSNASQMAITAEDAWNSAELEAGDARLTQNNESLSKVAPCIAPVFTHGRLASGVAVDRMFTFDDVVVMIGWHLNVTALRFQVDGEPSGSAPATCSFARPDVAAAYEVHPEQARGFIAVWSEGLPSSRVMISSVSEGGASMWVSFDTSPLPAARVGEVLRENRLCLGFLIRVLSSHPRWIESIVPLLPSPPPFFGGARGYIEQARGTPRSGGVVVGWCFALAPCETILITSSGIIEPFSNAVRWHREDVLQGFEAEFGQMAFNSGFMLIIRGQLEVGPRLNIVALDGDSAFSIATAEWTSAPQEPTSFARWLFSLPIPVDSFRTGVVKYISPLIDDLVEKKNKGFAEVKPVVHEFGEPHPAPICSIIIPLYGRSDFMQHQLMEFGDDTFIREKVELIYVVDDPRIRGAVLEQAIVLSEVYGVSFRVVDGRVNRGYSGANNIGAQVARGLTMVFLNSDVFPRRSGWLEKMLRALAEDAEVGIVGARLLFCNGTVQHDGMTFEWDAGLRAYLNKHPGAGMMPPASSGKAKSRVAVTGACLLIESDLFRGIGGFDEGFLLGDFEDSDLCLRVHAVGRSIVCVEDVDLVHLERQSFSGLGSGGFRQQVVYYNLYRHQVRWGAVIDDLLSGSEDGVS